MKQHPQGPPTTGPALCFPFNSCMHGIESTGQENLQTPSHAANPDSLPEFHRMSHFASCLFLCYSWFGSFALCIRAMVPSHPFKPLNLFAFIQFLLTTVFVFMVHLTLSIFFCGCEHDEYPASVPGNVTNPLPTSSLVFWLSVWYG